MKNPISQQIFSKKFRLPGWSVLVAAIIVASTSAFCIHQLNQWADRSNRSQVLIVSIAEKLRQLSALEWEAIAKKKVDSELEAEIKESREQIALMLDQVKATDVQSYQLKSFLNLYARYNTAVNKQMQLLATQQIELAIAVDGIVNLTQR